MNQRELAEKYGKMIAHRISARKHGGDDMASWAVFVDNRPFVEGLTQSEVGYYKAIAAAQLAGDTVPKAR